MRFRFPRHVTCHCGDSQELESGRELIRNVSAERTRLSDRCEQLLSSVTQLKTDYDAKLRELKVPLSAALFGYLNHQPCVRV